MNQDILMVVESVCNEKSLDREDVIGAIEAALAAVMRKDSGHDYDVRVEMDRKSGECSTFRRWLVMDDEDPEFESPDYQILVSQAQEKQSGVKIGEYVEEPMGSAAFGRIAAHTAKQVIVQKMREAERIRVVNIYKDRIGELVMGIVKREEHTGVLIDLGDNAEGFIAREQLIMRENFRPGDRVRAYLGGVSEDHYGPQLLLSRISPEFLIELFKLEVPEIGQGLIEIKGAARDPALRAKISVLSNDARLDPIGACVGMRGSRVQAVSNELAGERIDIILWDESPAQWVINAMSPATVLSIVVDEDKHSMDIAVEEEKLSQAIGRNGQNVKLASQLTGWELNVLTENQAEEKSEQEVQQLQNLFKEKLTVDEEVATILVQEGFSSIEEIVYVPVDELLRIEEFDKDIVEELRGRAGDVLLSMVIDDDNIKADGRESLERMDGVDEELIRKFDKAGIKTAEDLAEQGVEDLMEIDGMDRGKAKNLIMAAREPWFEEVGEKVPAEEGKKVPVKEGKKVPVKEDEKVPAEEGKKVPVKEDEKVSAEEGEKVPAEEGKKVPAEEDEKVSAQGSTQ